MFFQERYSQGAKKIREVGVAIYIGKSSASAIKLGSYICI